jgi:[ribosomal protein S5]-alanine N-acetyltransferase
VIELSDGVVRLRPLRRRDAQAWDRLRLANDRWLARWEASAPGPTGVRPTFGQYVREQARAARAGTGFSFGVVVDGQLVGHLTISSVTHGSLSSCSLGYWIGEQWAGRGLIPRAVALAADFAFLRLGLHRVEINIRPENAASLRVVEKLGFRDEGVRERYLHIAGGWRDHRAFALTAEEIGSGLVERLRTRAASRPSAADTTPDGAPEVPGGAASPEGSRGTTTA